MEGAQTQEIDLQCDESLSSQASPAVTHAEPSLFHAGSGPAICDVSSSEVLSSRRAATKGKRARSIEKTPSVGKTTPKKAASTKKSFLRSVDLNEYIKELKEIRHPRLPLGTRVWTRVFGSCDWPSVLWSLDKCPRASWQELIEGYADGKCLILFYGERSIMWVKPTQLSDIRENEENRISNMIKWGDRNGKTGLASAALEELYHSYDDPTDELNRIHSPSGFEYYSSVGLTIECCEECGEVEPQIFCEHCKKGWHTLCLHPPVLKKQDLKEGDTWNCSACSHTNIVAAPEELQKIESAEATGLTPDWIIHASAFDVFLLQEQTKDNRTFIKRLLDPCTNDKANPNIPAEKLYNKDDNGLKLSNSWEGYYVILNPDYKSQVQWRFVNRAVDEVENDRVPAVILVCRNSTDAAYYQRLRPYPRVLLRRQCVRFKNYEHTPIGFGIVVFCIAKEHWRDLYGRFFDAFSPYGEMNMAIDLKALQDPEFAALLERVQKQAAVSHRDHWLQCKECKKWRIVSYETKQNFRDKDWHCTDLKPRYSTCATLQRKVEAMGIVYASGGEHDFVRDFSSSTRSIYARNKPNQFGTEHRNKLGSAPLTVEKLPTEVDCKGENTQCFSTPVQRPDEDLNLFARRVHCQETLDKLVSLAPKSTPQKIRSLDVQSAENPSLPTDSVLSSLDLARQSRMAANRAFLKGLGKEPSAIHRGEIPPLPATNSLVADAAAEIHKKAEIADLEFQIQKAKRRCEEGRRKRQAEEARLMKELENKIRAEKEARRAKEIAIDAVKELELRLAQLTKRKAIVQ